MKATVIVTPKKTVLDPQGVAVRNAIHHLGMDCVEKVHVGKFIELEISGSDVAKTQARLEEIARDLLSNPVIEDFKVQINGTPKASTASSSSKSAPARKTSAPVKKKASALKKTASKIKKAPSKPKKKSRR
ncbi:MAG: phosphoribosylformylglycinamidine synthase subunit PurS [Verrucomicrobiae bacterium]|nr:phosphoribosylformylglycinamidine synthase subunit PurS [Verrucomicrobiae bacterium]